MRRDFQIAILLALATIPCGAWIAVAPEYLHIKGTALALTYWGGMVLTAVLIIAALLLAFRAESKTQPKGHGSRMVAIVGMAICGFGFLAFATVFFIQRPAEEDGEPKIHSSVSPLLRLEASFRDVQIRWPQASLFPQTDDRKSPFLLRLKSLTG